MMYEKRKRGRSKGTGWSIAWRHCRRCGRKDRPHNGRGYCDRCSSLLKYRRKHGIPEDYPLHGMYWRQEVKEAWLETL